MNNHNNTNLLFPIN